MGSDLHRKTLKFGQKGSPSKLASRFLVPFMPRRCRSYIVRLMNSNAGRKSLQKMPSYDASERAAPLFFVTLVGFALIGRRNRKGML